MAVNLTDDERALIKRRIVAAEADQRKHHRLWYEVLAFCQGYQWVVAPPAGSRTSQPIALDPPKHGQRYTVDEITQYRLTLAGELGGDDDRPEAQFEHDDAPTEGYADQANQGLGYAWDEEINADQVIAEARDTMIDLGTAPVRCRFDSSFGADTGDQPFIDGQLVGKDQAFQAMDAGQKVTIKATKAGRICWEAGTPFNTLTPPGVPREDDFKWLVWKSVAYLPDVKEQYPNVADELKADPVRSLATLSTPAQPATATSETAENLGDHCFVYTYYQYPSKKYPKGRVVVLGTEKQVPLETFDELPYRTPAGEYRPGVYFLHAIRLTDRFWSRGFVELALDPQRAINQHVTRMEQTVAKGQPIRWVEEGSVKKLPDGAAGSIGWLKPGKPRPQVDPGMAPGPWMKDMIVMQRENLARAVLPESAIGDNPDNVNTYSQLALLHAQARKRLVKIVAQNKRVIVHLCEDTCWDIKTKWGTEKQLRVAGTEGQLDAVKFDASQWPDYYKIRFATGASLPRTQEAQLKLVEDMWTAALQSGAAVQDPAAWLTWRKQSLEAGKVLDLPTPPTDAQRDKAQEENEMMSQFAAEPNAVQMAVGLVSYFDTAATHLPEHRSLQGQAQLMGRMDLFVVLEAHCKEHERQVAITAQEQMAAQPQPGPPGQPQPSGQPQPLNGNGAQPQPALTQ